MATKSEHAQPRISERVRRGETRSPWFHRQLSGGPRNGGLGGPPLSLLQLFEACDHSRTIGGWILHIRAVYPDAVRVYTCLPMRSQADLKMQGLLHRGSREPSVANSEVGILVRRRQPGSRGGDGEVGGVQGFHKLDEVLYRQRGTGIGFHVTVET